MLSVRIAFKTVLNYFLLTGGVDGSGGGTFLGGTENMP